MTDPKLSGAEYFALKLHGIPLAALSRTCAPHVTITPQTLADAQALTLSDDASLTLDATPTERDDPSPSSPHRPSARPSRVSTLQAGDSSVQLSQLAEAAAAWMDNLPTFIISDERPPPSPAPPNAPPPTRPDLALQSTLGQGGMGVVMGARQCALGRAVAVKMLRPEAADEPRAQALLREALIMGQLEHPNVVPVHALGRALGADPTPVDPSSAGPALVMKRVEGVSWQALIHDPAHPMWAQLDASASGDRLGFHLSTLSQVCRALEFAHSRGIIHRDVKPENVMIGHYGEVYLLDWGVALHLDERAALRRPALLGTPSFMAPEMARGDVHEVDARSDVYLVGATLHEALTGTPRHAGESLIETLYAASVSAPVTFGPSMPAELGRIINRATAADPTARFQDVASLREAVTAYLRHRASLALSDEARAHAQAVLLALLDAKASAATGAATGTANNTAAGAEGVQARFSASVFGYQMALREWPGNEDAARGLAQVVEAMARASLASGEVEYAARLLGEHPAVGDAALRAEVARRAEDLRSGREDLDALLRMRQDLDLSRNHKPRQAFFGFLVVVAVAASAVVLAPGAGEDAMWGRVFWVLGASSLAFLGAIWWVRDALARAAVDRRMVTGVGVFFVGLWVQRLLAWSRGAPLATSFTYDALLGVICGLMMAALLDKRLVWAALSFGVGLVGTVLFPARADAAFGLGTVLCMISIILAFRSTSARQPAH